MVSSMLDLRFKCLRMISSFVEKDQGIAIVQEYDKKSLYPMLVKCYEHLQLFVRSFVDDDCFIKITI